MSVFAAISLFPMPAFGRQQLFHTHTHSARTGRHISKFWKFLGSKTRVFPDLFAAFPPETEEEKQSLGCCTTLLFFFLFFSLTKHASFLHKEKKWPHFLSYLKCLNRKFGVAHNFPLGHYFIIDCFGTNKHC